jgi:hypothetical protein
MYCLCRFCCSTYCLCVNVYCTIATGCQTNCNLKNISYHISKHFWTTCTGKDMSERQTFIDCEINDLVIIRTWHEKPMRKFYTWRTPGDRNRNQLHSILAKHWSITVRRMCRQRLKHGIFSKTMNEGNGRMSGAK